MKHRHRELCSLIDDCVQHNRSRFSVNRGTVVRRYGA